MRVTVYLASAMSGRTGRVLLAQSAAAAKFFETRGIVVLDPIVLEGALGDGPLLPLHPDRLHEKWTLDKASIRKSNVVIDLTANRHSHGVSQELGYARWFLFMPVVRVFNGPVPLTVAMFEDDASVETWEQAAYLVVERWGTRWLRFLWRVKVYGKYWRRGFWFKLVKWFQ